MNNSWIVVVAPRAPSDREFNEFLPGIHTFGLKLDSTYMGAKRLRAVGVVGHGSISDEFVSSTDGLDGYILRHQGLQPAELGGRLRGSVQGIVMDEVRKELYVLPDPLGGSFVFRWQHGDLVILSSDLNRLVDCAAEFGFLLQRSLAYLLSVVVVGNGGLFPSSYEGVDVVAQGTFLTVGLSGVRTHDYPSLNMADQKYSDQLDVVGQDMLQNLQAAASSQAQFKIAHLTGGFDSRLILAGLGSLGKTDDFSFHCSGPAETPDRKVFDGLVRQFGLTPTRHPGYDVENSYATYRDGTLGNMNRMAGLLPNAPGLGFKPLMGGSVILSGGYGEVLRSFYGSRSRGALSEGMEAVPLETWGRLGFGGPGERLISQELCGELTSRIHREIQVGAALGYRNDALMDRLYLKIRNRYYVGLITGSVGQNVPRFDPLYSPAGAQAALAQPLEERASNFIGIDLMERFMPGIKDFPFDINRFNDYFRLKRGEPTARELPAIPEIEWDPRETSVTGVRTQGLPRPTSTDIEFANSIRASPGQVAGLAKVRGELREMVSSIGRSALSEHFDYAVLSRLLTADLRNRVHIRTCYSLYGALLWYYEGSTSHI